MKANWFLDGFRKIIGALVYGVYELVEWAMHGIFDIAGLQTHKGLVGDIYIRIYAILGIFMAFKLIMSFLSYMTNPDSMADKEKGAGKLITKVITMLALLLMLPNFFPLLNRVQTEFLPVLPRIILGERVDNSNTVTDNAKILSASALSAFYQPCSKLKGSAKPKPISDIDQLMDTVTDKTHGYYDYDFNWALALVVGVVMVFILISMTVKIGIRLFKMLVLEMIAPIPVMSYIDPKSSKDGAFASWVKQLTKTFLDIFVRLGVIYVVLMILSYMNEGGGLAGLFSPDSIPRNPLRVSYLTVFLMIALLMFAKDAPNFIKDAFGLKHDKELNAGAAGVAGATFGGIAGLASGRSFSGMVTGAVHGGAAAIEGAKNGKSVSGWRVGGDAALQARTGDSKAKSGILAALQASSSKAQLSRSASKLGLTNETIEQAKQNMLGMQALEAEAVRLWDRGVNGGGWYDLEGNDLGPDGMEKVAAIVAETHRDSAIATKNFEKMNKAGDVYGINRNFAQDLAYERQKVKKSGGSRKQVYEAGRANPLKSHKEKEDYRRS